MRKLKNAKRLLFFLLFIYLISGYYVLRPEVKCVLSYRFWLVSGGLVWQYFCGSKILLPVISLITLDILASKYPLNQDMMPYTGT